MKLTSIMRRNSAASDFTNGEDPRCRHSQPEYRSAAAPRLPRWRPQLKPGLRHRQRLRNARRQRQWRHPVPSVGAHHRHRHARHVSADAISRPMPRPPPVTSACAERGVQTCAGSLKYFHERQILRIFYTSNFCKKPARLLASATPNAGVASARMTTPKKPQMAASPTNGGRSRQDAARISARIGGAARAGAVSSPPLATATARLPGTCRAMVDRPCFRPSVLRRLPTHCRISGSAWRDQACSRRTLDRRHDRPAMVGEASQCCFSRRSGANQPGLW